MKTLKGMEKGKTQVGSGSNARYVTSLLGQRKNAVTLITVVDQMEWK
jgi:hypothetical protein